MSDVMDEESAPIPVAFSFLGLKYTIILDENEHLRSGPQFLGDPNLFLCVLVMFLGAFDWEIRISQSNDKKGNLKNPDLDFLIEIYPEDGFLGGEIRFRISRSIGKSGFRF